MRFFQRSFSKISCEFFLQKYLSKHCFTSYPDFIEKCTHHEFVNVFWNDLAKSMLSWQKMHSITSNVDIKNGKIRWFEDGMLNVSENCLDRHSPDKVALIYEKDEPDRAVYITYRELLDLTCRIANLLKLNGVQKGDPVVLYLPTSPIAVASMLACCRIGAIHSVVFAGFSPQALAVRIVNAGAKVILSCDEFVRGGQTIPLKDYVNKAIDLCPPDLVRTVLVYRETETPDVVMQHPRDQFMDEMLDKMPSTFQAESMNAEDPLFILYTSGSTGVPKGLVHSQAGYLLYAAATLGMVFDYNPQCDIFGCVADIGWITGHSYAVYGPLCSGGTTLLFGSTPIYPDPGRYWEMVERLKLTSVYLAPTVLRLLIKHGDHFVKRYDRSSLRLLGCVGEPLDEKTWYWYYHVVGEERCPVIDTWWQTESGGILLAPRPSANHDNIIPGMAMRPLPGIEPVVMVTSEGIDGDVSQTMTLNHHSTKPEKDLHGHLYIKGSWPGMARTMWSDHKSFLDNYYRPYPGYYFTGDGVIRHRSGYYQITGRIDDVINTSGHRVGTAEIENALSSNENVAESAVVGYPHEILGEAIYAYVVLRCKHSFEDAVKKALRLEVRQKIAGYAVPAVIQIVPDLPRTRSGKIMRRILKKIAMDQFEDLGELSTLANQSVVSDIIDIRKKLTK